MNAKSTKSESTPPQAPETTAPETAAPVVSTTATSEPAGASPAPAESTPAPSAPAVTLEGLAARLEVVEGDVKRFNGLFGFLKRELARWGIKLSVAMLIMVGALSAQAADPNANMLVRWDGTNGSYVAIMKNGLVRSVSAGVTNDIPVGGVSGGASGAIAATSLTASSDATLSAFLELPRTAVTVTNRGVITATSSVMLVTPSDQDGGVTQTNTVAEPGVSGLGRMLWIVNAGPTNIVINDSATLINTAGNSTLGTDDALPLYGITTNKWQAFGAVANN